MRVTPYFLISLKANLMQDTTKERNRLDLGKLRERESKFSARETHSQQQLNLVNPIHRIQPLKGPVRLQKLVPSFMLI